MVVGRQEDARRNCTVAPVPRKLTAGWMALSLLPHPIDLHAPESHIYVAGLMNLVSLEVLDLMAWDNQLGRASRNKAG